MEKMKVSIIMPVYNAEAFLKRSIESVKNQTHNNWELIVVDDGSTDNSWEIVQAYSALDPRIKLLCNQHGGTARARNSAMDVAGGDYFAFIDADDVYHPQYLESLMAASIREKADMVICGITQGTDYETFLRSSVKAGYRMVTANEAFSMMYGGQWPLMISPWNKLYARNLFRTVRFPDGRFFEDAATVNLALYHSSSVCILDANLYFYYITPNSSSKTKRSVELLDREWALRSHWEYFFKEKKDNLAYLAIPFYLIELISIYNRIAISDRPEDCRIIREQFERVYHEYRRKIKFTETQKDQILAFRYPHIYDIRNMIRSEGVLGTILGFVKRKINYHE